MNLLKLLEHCQLNTKTSIIKQEIEKLQRLTKIAPTTEYQTLNKAFNTIKQLAKIIRIIDSNIFDTINILGFTIKYNQPIQIIRKTEWMIDTDSTNDLTPFELAKMMYCFINKDKVSQTTNQPSHKEGLNITKTMQQDKGMQYLAEIFASYFILTTEDFAKSLETPMSLTEIEQQYKLPKTTIRIRKGIYADFKI